MSKLQANQDYLNQKIEKLEKILNGRNVYVVVAKKYINVRIKPSMKSPTVGKIPHGMEIFAYCKKSSKWCMTNNGRYVYKKLLVKLK